MGLIQHKKKLFLRNIWAWMWRMLEGWQMCSFLLFYTSVVFNTFFCRRIQWLLPTRQVYKQEITWDCRMTNLCLSYLTTSSPEWVVFNKVFAYLALWHYYSKLYFLIAFLCSPTLEITQCLFTLSCLSSSVHDGFIEKLWEAVKRSQTRRITKNCFSWIISVTVMDVNEVMDALGQ